MTMRVPRLTGVVLLESSASSTIKLMSWSVASSDMIASTLVSKASICMMATLEQSTKLSLIRSGHVMSRQDELSRGSLASCRLPPSMRYKSFWLYKSKYSDKVEAPPAVVLLEEVVMLIKLKVLWCNKRRSYKVFAHLGLGIWRETDPPLGSLFGPLRASLCSHRKC